MSNKIRLLALAFIIFCIDYLSKAYVHSHVLPMNFCSPCFPYGGIGVFHNFQGIDFAITHTTNKGAAWGMFAGFQQWLLYFRIVVICALLGYFLFFNRIKARQIPFVLILAGASGNVIDYFIYGHVVDMFLFRFWGYFYPVFNIADAAIFCGITWLILQSFFVKSSKQLSRVG